MFCNNCARRTVGAEFFCRSCGAALPLGGPSTAVTPVVGTEPPAVVGDEASLFAPIRGPLLVIRRGPKAGGWFALVAPLVRIGRHPDSDIFLDHITVSRRHAVLRVDRSQTVFADLGSMNGSYINGILCEAEHVLEHGDRVRIGLFELVYFAVVAGDGPDAAGTSAAPRGTGEP